MVILVSEPDEELNSFTKLLFRPTLVRLCLHLAAYTGGPTFFRRLQLGTRCAFLSVTATRLA